MSHIEEVANRLKGLRDALGLTIAEMASACSVDEELYRAGADDCRNGVGLQCGRRTI